MRSRPSVPAATKWRPKPEITWHHDRYLRDIIKPAGLIWNDSNSMRSSDCQTQLHNDAKKTIYVYPLSTGCVLFFFNNFLAINSMNH